MSYQVIGFETIIYEIQGFGNDNRDALALDVSDDDRDPTPLRWPLEPLLHVKDLLKYLRPVASPENKQPACRSSKALQNIHHWPSL